MQQLLYKYLILNNRLNIPSLGSFSVSYQPARLNSSTGALDPKQPILQFKDGPPSTPDTGLIPFLASEMKISPASAANELLNFSLQVMSELVEHQRARLKGLGTLTKDSGGLIHFEQENSPVAVQSSVVAREPASAPVPVAATQPNPSPVTPVAPQPVAAAPIPSVPSRVETPLRAATPSSTSAENSKLPPGQLDPSLDYAGIKSYQESPELSQVRQQLAQRREQVNSVFGDLRDARERMNRVPLPGKEGESLLPSTQTPSSITTNTPRPNTTLPQPTAPRMPRSTTGTGRRPNPLLSPDPLPARQPQWQPGDTSSRNNDSNTFTGMPNEFPARSPFGKPDESAAFKKDSDALSGLPVDLPSRTPRPSNPPPIPPITSRRNTEPPVFPENNDPAPVWSPTPRPSTPPANRSWNVPNEDTPPAVPFSRSVPPAADGGAVRDMKRSPLRSQPIPTPIPTSVPESKTNRWAPKENDAVARQAVSLPNRFAQQEEVEEEEEPRPGFFARMKASISGIFRRNREEVEVTTIEEQQLPEEETAGRVGGIFSKASAKFEEIRSNELEASAEDKKDYWWIYSIFLGSVATLALIFRLF
jgi:nucleoid DNA-binding protein